MRCKVLPSVVASLCARAACCAAPCAPPRPLPTHLHGFTRLACFGFWNELSHPPSLY